MGDSKFQILQTPTKSESDKNEYRTIKLENELLATIISDKSSNKNEHELDTQQSHDKKLAGVTMYIGVGCLSDPIEIPGLSHFLEHMVFMGSEKFPVENEFDSFIRNSGGQDNAYTEYEGTTFYFECFEKYLPEALDKFSQFFIAPLMKREALDREREAVDSEFQMAVTVDANRKQQLLMSTAKQDSAVHRCFLWGNLKTLKDNMTDERLYEELHKHRKRYYSAHRMSLAVQARLPLDTLQKLVVQHFSNIPNNKLPPLDFSAFKSVLFDTPDFNKIYYVKPLNEITEVEINWTFPTLKCDYKSKHIQYLSNVLGDEGKGSILSYLKRQSWAVSLTAGNCYASFNNNMFSFFSIIVALTEEGLRHVFDIIDVIFSYINILKNVGPQKRIYDELKFAAGLNFRFAAEMSAVSVTNILANAMQVYPPVDIICGSKLYYEYNPEKITEGLNYLTPRRANILITSKKLPNGLSFDSTERWFGVEYTSTDIPENLLLKWETVAPYPELNIPLPNPYLPSNFTILPQLPNQSIYPQKLIDTPKCELWYKQDQTFQLPQASYFYLLMNPICLESAKNSALTEMYVDLLSFAIGEEAYPASLASSSCYFGCDQRGIGFEVFGFNEKLPVLVKLIIKYIKHLGGYIDEDHFNGIKETLLNCYHNKMLQPNCLQYELESKLLLKNHFSTLNKYSELSKVTFDDMHQFIKTFHERLYVKALVQGNVLPDAACETTNNLIKYLEFDEISKEQYPKIRTFQIPVGEKCLRVESLNKKDPNSVISNYYQVGAFTLKDNVFLDIIIRIIGEPMFNVLRTKEQLGYYVSCLGRRSHGVLEYCLLVNTQANKFSTEYLDSRMEAFLNQSQTLIEETSVDKLEKIKEDLNKTKECYDNNLIEEAARIWSEITYDEYMFDRTKQEVEILKNITLDEVVIWWNKLRAGNLRKISIQIVGHIQHSDTTFEENTPDENENRFKDVTLKILINKNMPERNDYFIENIDEFVDNLCTYPEIIHDQE